VKTKNNIHDRKEETRLTSLKDTLRSEGLLWLLRRLRHRTPFTPSGRAIHFNLRRILGMLLTIPRAIKGLSGEPGLRNSEDILFAFFDLQVAPITYDASWFVAAADHMRRQRGLKRIHFVIVPGNNDGFREERAAYESTVDTATRQWRLYNIVFPILTLLPAFGGVTFLPNRGAVGTIRAAAQDRTYPEHYEPGLPVSHLPVELLGLSESDGQPIGVLRSPTQARRYIDRWIASRVDGRRLITITIRDYQFMPARNSNMQAWAAFAGRLNAAEYFPVFVLDTERTLDPSPEALAGFEILREASWNVWLRMALYETGYLNLGVNNGPLFMCMLNAQTRVLIFKIITPSVPQTTEELMSTLGFKIGGQVPFATPFQRLVWEDDTLETIEREFRDLVANIDEVRHKDP
jgi:hypothetical protein